MRTIERITRGSVLVFSGLFVAASLYYSTTGGFLRFTVYSITAAGFFYAGLRIYYWLR